MHHSVNLERDALNATVCRLSVVLSKASGANIERQKRSFCSTDQSSQHFELDFTMPVVLLLAEPCTRGNSLLDLHLAGIGYVSLFIKDHTYHMLQLCICHQHYGLTYVSRY